MYWAFLHYSKSVLGTFELRTEIYKPIQKPKCPLCVEHFSTRGCLWKGGVNGVPTHEFTITRGIKLSGTWNLDAGRPAEQPHKASPADALCNLQSDTEETVYHCFHKMLLNVEERSWGSKFLQAQMLLMEKAEIPIPILP